MRNIGVRGVYACSAEMGYIEIFKLQNQKYSWDQIQTTKIKYKIVPSKETGQNEGQRKTGDIGGRKLTLVMGLALEDYIPEIYLLIIINSGALLSSKK